MAELTDFPRSAGAGSAGYVYDGTNWIPVAPQMLRHYESRVAGDITLVATGAGYQNLPGTAVPASKIWRITMIDAWNNSRIAADIYLECYIGGVRFILADGAPSAISWQKILWCDLTLAAGDYINARLNSTVIGDTLRLQYLGVQQSVP